MLHLYSGYAILLQHFRRYLYGSYLLCDPESDDWKSKRKEDQRINVCTYGIIHIEICLSVKYNRKRRTKRDRSSGLFSGLSGILQGLPMGRSERLMKEN